MMKRIFCTMFTPSHVHTTFYVACVRVDLTYKNMDYGDYYICYVTDIRPTTLSARLTRLTI